MQLQAQPLPLRHMDKRPKLHATNNLGNAHVLTNKYLALTRDLIQNHGII